MEITEHAINVLTTVATEVQAHFTDFSDLANGWEHTHQVYHLALILSDQEHADGFIVGMAEHRIAFLRLYLQELQQELAEGGYGYDKSAEVTSRLLWVERRKEEQQEKQAEDPQRRRVVPLHEQHSA